MATKSNIFHRIAQRIENIKIGWLGIWFFIVIIMSLFSIFLFIPSYVLMFITLTLFSIFLYKVNPELLRFLKHDTETRDKILTLIIPYTMFALIFLVKEPSYFNINFIFILFTLLFLYYCLPNDIKYHHISNQIIKIWVSFIYYEIFWFLAQ